MTAGMWAALPGLLAGLAGDPGVRVLVVTGAGPSFCAGADIADLLGGPDPDDPMAEVRRDNLAAQAALRAFPHPTVAAVRGHCIGGGGGAAAPFGPPVTDPTRGFRATPAQVGGAFAPPPAQGPADLPGAG